MKKLSLEEVKRKTLELLKTSDLAKVAHITEQNINVDNAINDDGSEKATLTGETREGHNMRYQYVDAAGEYCYVYERGDTVIGSGCGNVTTKWLRHSQWDHNKIGDCSPHDALLRFTKR